MNLKPLGDRLIVEVLDEEETTFSGIVLPDTAKEKPQRGRVLAVGPGSRDEKGKHIEMDVEEGDEGVFEYSLASADDARGQLELSLTATVSRAVDADAVGAATDLARASQALEAAQAVAARVVALTDPAK